MPAWNRIELPKDKLENLYLKRKLSIAQIAEKLGHSTGPVHRSLREYKIPTRNLSEACTKAPVTKKQLKEWYFKEKLSMFEIADRLGCTHSAIVYKFQKFGIESRGSPGLTTPIKLAKKGFEHLYYKRGLSLKKIARIAHCSESGLERRFKQYGLKSRGIKNRACKYKKIDFSGDPIEKAYLIGFRLGDLNVMKGVSVIQVRCSTTVYHQLNLIRDIFSPYTTVRSTKGKRGDWDVVAMVNRSFDFLLPKHEIIPDWITQNPKTFFAFFAGYTDAEGCFYFKKPKRKNTKIASFEIQTQDKQIIHQLWENMQKYGVSSPRPNVSIKAGVRSNGNKNNKDMWRFEVCRKESLWKLIHYLQPHILHGAKIKRIKEVRRNIIMRNSSPYCRPIDLAMPKPIFSTPSLHPFHQEALVEFLSPFRSHL